MTETAWTSPPDDPTPEPTGEPVRWLVTAVAFAVVLGLVVLPVPGLDASANLALGQPISIIGGSLGLLAAVHGLAEIRVSGGGSVGRSPVVLYLVATVGWAWSAAHLLEVSSYGMQPLVLAPGLGFRLLTIATLTAGAALYWVLARWVSRAGVGTGAFVLPAGVGGVYGLMLLARAGRAVGDGMSADPALLAPIAGTMLVFVALALWQPEWPWRPLAWLRLGSWVDVASLPLVAVMLAHALVAWTGWQGALAMGWAAIPVALALVKALAGEERGFRPGMALVSAALAVLSLGVLSAGWAASGALERLAEPGPFDGDQSLTVVLGSEAPDRGDQAVLEKRLDALGVDGTVAFVGGELVVELRGVGQVELLLDAVLRPGTLECREVDEAWTERLALTPDLSVPDDRVVAESCWNDRCQGMVLGPSELDNRQLAEAAVIWTDYGGPAVLVTLTDEGRQRFAELSTRLVRKRFALVVDGRVEMAPVVQEPIVGGKLHVALGSTDHLERKARVLAAVLDSGPLGADWFVQATR